ncbi:spore germination protein [Ferdinandcohnia quinoae]|uniref:Spore germination protein n=1 Tax=Fredinandcohnia quinoae TaxID=2918902 RepID=A0AAW5E378_9BACI|nr:spore germination protein [Fredinandcohnia sp. SECRCQ15]MCH1627375.1 spore germination protein [Fredinandcohnia sp. SECRCQ15]
MNDRYMIGPIKINSQSGNSSVNFGDASIANNSVTKKGQGNALGIGDLSSVFAPMNNRWIDNDVSDQNSGNSPSENNPLQT